MARAFLPGRQELPGGRGGGLLPSAASQRRQRPVPAVTVLTQSSSVISSAPFSGVSALAVCGHVSLSFPSGTPAFCISRYVISGFWSRALTSL